MHKTISILLLTFPLMVPLAGLGLNPPINVPRVCVVRFFNCMNE